MEQQEKHEWNGDRDDKSFTTSNQQWQTVVTYALFIIKWFFIIILITKKISLFLSCETLFSAKRNQQKNLYVHVCEYCNNKLKKCINFRNCLHHEKIFARFSLLLLRKFYFISKSDLVFGSKKVTKRISRIMMSFKMWKHF